LQQPERRPAGEMAAFFPNVNEFHLQVSAIPFMIGKG
jgi:hypothetical protein